MVWFSNDETSIFGSPPLPHGVCDHGDGTQASPGSVPTFRGLHVAARAYFSGPTFIVLAEISLDRGYPPLLK